MELRCFLYTAEADIVCIEAVETAVLPSYLLTTTNYQLLCI